MAETIGPRFVSIDLDVVITGDITPVFDRAEDFVIFCPKMRGQLYNGSMFMMNAGAREQVYTDFDPRLSPMTAKRSGFRGSDQAWIGYKLGPNEAVWDERHGVYAWKKLVRYRLPEDARMVFFFGNEDPWNTYAQIRAPWIKAHYR